MPRLSKIVWVGQAADKGQSGSRSLPEKSFQVRAVESPDDAGRPAEEADLIVIDAATPLDVTAAVRKCRQLWTDRTLPVVVVNLADPHAAAAAIDAGATESIAGADEGPVLAAHLARLLRSRDALRRQIEDECDRLRRESLARAAAEVAQPLGELIDRIEAAAAKPPSDAIFEELLDQVGQAVDAVDRLRRMAAPPGAAGEADGHGRAN